MGRCEKKHQVLFLESGVGYGGSTSFLYYFLNNLDRELFEPGVVFYYRNDGPHKGKIETLGIEVVDLGARFQETEGLTDENTHSEGVSLLRKLEIYGSSLAELSSVDVPLVLMLSRLIKERKIELTVLNNDVQYHPAGVIASRICGIPCICRKAGIGNGERSKKILSRFVDLFIASSNAASEDYLRDGLPGEKLVMIYEGVDLREFDPSRSGLKMRRELKIARSKVVVGSVARLSPGKGHLGLLKAAASIVKQNPRVVFLIVGDAPLSNGKMLHMLKEKTFELGIERNVIFTGWRNDIPDVLSAVDVYVQNSIEPEGLGIAALEAAAMGKPMIVTDAGGLGETVADGRTGYIVPVGDTDLLVSAIGRLVDSPASRNKMRGKTREFVEKNFDISNLMRDYERELLRVLDGQEMRKHS